MSGRSLPFGRSRGLSDGPLLSLRSSWTSSWEMAKVFLDKKLEVQISGDGGKFSKEGYCH